MAMIDEATKTAMQELESLEDANTERLARIIVDAAKSGRAGYTLDLYEPITVGAEARSSLHFRPQTIADVRACKSDDELTARLSGLEVAHLLQFSTIDYEAAQKVLAGFQLRRAAGGPARTG